MSDDPWRATFGAGHDHPDQPRMENRGEICPEKQPRAGTSQDRQQRAHLLVAPPVRAQEAAFHCTFKAVFETIDSDNPARSAIEKQFVGHRMDVQITEKPIATAVGDVFTITKQASDYVVSQRGSIRNDWVLFRTDHGSASETITVIHIRTWNRPVRFTFAWGSTLAVGTCEEVK